jgi:hypothetical protein
MGLSSFIHLRMPAHSIHCPFATHSNFLLGRVVFPLSFDGEHRALIGDEAEKLKTFPGDGNKAQK